MKKQLELSKLHVSIEDKEIIKGISLTVKPGEIHAIMGPNGSGKSTTAATLAGHPDYSVTSGDMILDGESLLDASPDERAQLGLFLAFQYPVEVPGVKVQNFLRHAHQARFADKPKKQFEKVIDFRKHLKALAAELQINPELLSRGLNEGFSGGEKKQLEILQMAVLEPKYAILDETDSGLDIDAIKKVSAGVTKVAKKHKTGVLVITHYKRILEYLKPDHVHVMVKGKIVKSGGPELVDKLESEGYKDWRGEEA
ncbi:MAG: Fe-S cluster assembly ATPase SufC [Pseudomonadales bacterium]|nr:Fe-S cluster assembly ATPase SufC [Candidatus Woesebacteria bacterium]MCB9801060.1 Fe-S cluster assembly ATPase SufC [Pseudomonadales bacterium]